MRTGIFLKALEGKDSTEIPSNVFIFPNSERLKYVLDVLGVAYIATENDQDPAISYFRSTRFQKDLTKIYEDERHDVYENKTAYPRFGLYYDVKSGLDEKDILDDIKNRKTDLRNTVLLEETLSQKISTGTGSATLISSDLNTQTFSVESDTPAIFYVSDTFFPGWTVTIDGKKSHLYRANYNFRGVLVPEGKSQVIFKYDPFSYRFGKYVSVGSFLSLMLFGGVYIFIRNKLKKKEK